MSRAGWRVIRTLAPALVAACVAMPAWTFQSPGPDATVENTLSEAKRLYEATEYEGAVTALDRAIGLIDARATQSPARIAQLTGAYELRARARFGLNDTEGARSDFKSLLEIEPAHRLPAEISPKVVVIFNDVRKMLVGVLNLTVVPSDADVQIDNVASRDRGVIAIVAGQHSVTARRAGYGPVSQPVSVTANEAIDLTLTLERVSGVLSLVTVPADVEVLLDGSARGRTDSGASSPESMPFLLTDLAPGVHVIRVQRPCYVPVEQRLEFKAADYRLEPVRLARAVGALSVTGTQRGTVFVDGKPQGPTPASIDGVCEGPHVVEVRSPVGRYVRRFEMHVGEKIAISADLRPAIALLSVTGLPEGLRGGPDLRLKMEDVFRASSTVTLFAAPAEQVEQLLGREQLRPGWMSFDTVRRPIGEAAASITAGARMELAGKLTRALDVQAVAAVTVPSKEDTSDVLLTVLAAGSGQPDTVRIKLDDPESVARAVSMLDTAPQLFRLSADLQVADVLDVPGAVVISARAWRRGRKGRRCGRRCDSQSQRPTGVRRIGVPQDAWQREG